MCAVIDNILLNEKPASFEGFLQKLEQQGYEIKRGKHASVKGARQKRFIRFRTLGAGYSEDNPKAYCWLIRSLKAQGMNELATNELAAAKEHLTTEEYEEILAFGANW